MKVLILGADGFIGSHLTESILNTTDWQVVAFDYVRRNLKGLKTPILLLKKVIFLRPTAGLKTRSKKRMLFCRWSVLQNRCIILKNLCGLLNLILNKI